MIPTNPKKNNAKELELPIVNLPQWLPLEIKTAVGEHLAFIIEQKDAPIRKYFDLYSYLIRCFNRTQIIFTDNKMKELWGFLYKKSPSITVDFAKLFFFNLENDYDGATTMLDKHQAEIKSSEKIIKLAEKLYAEMESHRFWFYGHTVQDNHDDLAEELKNLRTNMLHDLNLFKEHIKSESYMFGSHWPITRKNKSDKALAIFFIRKIYAYFLEQFDKPMYNHIATIINIIFSTDYNENDVTKFSDILKKTISKPDY
jgi:hypothetical protein